MTQTKALDCTGIPSQTVLRYYLQEIELWMAYERYAEFLKFVTEKGIFQQRGSVEYSGTVRGVTFKYLKNGK